MEKNLIFLHIPKCAGTTFHRILERIYEGEKGFLLEKVGEKHTHEQFAELTDSELESLSLVRGHLEYGFHKNLPGSWRYITFLRDPVKRVESFYRYVSTSPNHELYEWIHQEQVSLERFVIETNRKDVHEVAVRWLSGIEAEPEEMLAKALENIDRHFSVVGLVERFDESLVLMQRKFNWPIPHYEVRNQTISGSLDRTGDKVWNEILKRNRADIELYRLMNKRLSDQIAQQPRLLFRVGLQKLRARNILSNYPTILKTYHKLKVR